MSMSTPRKGKERWRIETTAPLQKAWELRLGFRCNCPQLGFSGCEHAWICEPVTQFSLDGHRHSCVLVWLRALHKVDVSCHHTCYGRIGGSRLGHPPRRAFHSKLSPLRSPLANLCHVLNMGMGQNRPTRDLRF